MPQRRKQTPKTTSMEPSRWSKGRQITVIRITHQGKSAIFKQRITSKPVLFSSSTSHQKYIFSPISNSVLMYLLVSEHLFLTQNNQDGITTRAVVPGALLCDVLLLLFTLFCAAPND